MHIYIQKWYQKVNLMDNYSIYIQYYQAIADKKRRAPRTHLSSIYKILY